MQCGAEHVLTTVETDLNIFWPLRDFYLWTLLGNFARKKHYDCDVRNFSGGGFTKFVEKMNRKRKMSYGPTRGVQ